MREVEFLLHNYTGIQKNTQQFPCMV